jgi:hypothetical protein
MKARVLVAIEEIKPSDWGEGLQAGNHQQGRQALQGTGLQDVMAIMH